MLYIEKDSVHWEMFKNDCIEKEKEQIIKAANQKIVGDDSLLETLYFPQLNNKKATSKGEAYYELMYNNSNGHIYDPKKEEQLSFLAKQSQELDLGYEEFELGGEG
jgi:hypothetical protein